MPHYLLSVHNDGTSPYATEEDMQRAFAATGAFNEELRSAGMWVFAGGLEFPDSAKVVRRRDGALERTDGPFIESKEQVGGITIIDAADLDAALGWASRLTVAIGVPIEVRPFAGWAN